MLKYWTIVLTIFLSSPTVKAAPLINLETFLWSNRLILIFDEKNDFHTHRAKLEKMDIEIEDRHIIWFIINDQQLQTNFTGEIGPNLRTNLIRQWTNQNNNHLKVILIGKDGYEKLRLDSLDLDNIFSIIDQMPMRLYEMKTQRKMN